MMNSACKKQDGAAKMGQGNNFLSVIQSDQKDSNNLESRLKSVRMMSSLSPTPIKKENVSIFSWFLILVQIINSYYNFYQKQLPVQQFAKITPQSAMKKTCQPSKVLDKYMAACARDKEGACHDRHACLTWQYKLAAVAIPPYLARLFPSPFVGP